MSSMSAPKIQIVPLRPLHPRNNSSNPPNANAQAAALAEATQKKPRRSAPKVRTGCITCKIRRIKCDEGKPACNRCTSTGRQCDGYILPIQQHNVKADHSKPLTRTSSPEACLDVIRGSPEELLALEYFQARTAPNLSSYFDAAFWSRFVLQVSRVEPSIKHAMIAVGALNRQRESLFTGDETRLPTRLAAPSQVPLNAPVTNHDDPFVLSHYNKAIKLLAKRLEDSEAATEVALLACILFVCVEFLRGDSVNALLHFRNGMSIALASMAQINSTKALLTVERIRESLLPVLQRLELLSMLFGVDIPYEYPVTLDEALPKRPFASMTEARDSIMHLLNISLRFIRSQRGRRNGEEGGLTLDDFIRREELVARLNDWEHALDNLMAASSMSLRDTDAAKVLRVHNLIAKIWLGANCSGTEAITDTFNHYFERAVTLGEDVHRNAWTREQRDAKPSSFLFDMELISPMYFVAMKCRHPVTRRRAIALLKQSHRREGLWDGDVAAAIGTRIAELEEVHLTALDGTQLPAEKDRIHNTNIDTSVGIVRRTVYLTFMSKPQGLDGPFEIWQEALVVTDTGGLLVESPEGQETKETVEIEPLAGVADALEVQGWDVGEEGGDFWGSWCL